MIVCWPYLYWKTTTETTSTTRHATKLTWAKSIEHSIFSQWNEKAVYRTLIKAGAYTQLPTEFGGLIASRDQGQDFWIIKEIGSGIAAGLVVHEAGSGKAVASGKAIGITTSNYHLGLVCHFCRSPFCLGIKKGTEQCEGARAEECWVRASSKNIYSMQLLKICSPLH